MCRQPLRHGFWQIVLHAFLDYVVNVSRHDLYIYTPTKAANQMSGPHKSGRSLHQKINFSAMTNTTTQPMDELWMYRCQPPFKLYIHMQNLRTLMLWLCARFNNLGEISGLFWPQLSGSLQLRALPPQVRKVLSYRMVLLQQVKAYSAAITESLLSSLSCHTLQHLAAIAITEFMDKASMLLMCC